MPVPLLRVSGCSFKKCLSTIKLKLTPPTIISTEASVPPSHAINRGIFMEGLGCVLSGFWGSGNGSTSYAMNIGTIGITRVASRRVIIVAGALMIVFGLVSKVGALFISIPDPILGGLFCYTFPLVVAVAFGTLSEVCLESSRNVFIVAFAIFGGLVNPQNNSESK